MATKSASPSKIIWVRVPGHYTKELDDAGHYPRVASMVRSALMDQLDPLDDPRPREVFFKTELGAPKIGSKGDLFVKFRLPPGHRPAWLLGELRGIVLTLGEDDPAAARIFPMELIVDTEILDEKDVRTNPGLSKRKPTPTFVQHCVLGVAKTAAKKRAKASGRMRYYEDDWMEFAKPEDANSAFAICVSQGQRHGYLAPGTIQVTPKGKGKVTKHRRGIEEQAKTAEYEDLLKVMKAKRARKKAKVVKLPRRERLPELVAANPMPPMWRTYQLRHGDVFLPTEMIQHRNKTFWVVPAMAVGFNPPTAWVAYLDTDGKKEHYRFIDHDGGFAKLVVKRGKVYYHEGDVLYPDNVSAMQAVEMQIAPKVLHNPKAKRLGRRRNQMPRGYFYGNDGETVTTTELKPGIYKDGAVAPIYWVKEWAWEKGIELLSKSIISQGVMAWEKAECHPKFNVNVID